MTKEKKSKNEILQEKIISKKESAWKKFDAKQKYKAMEFAEDYKNFLKNSKNERAAIQNIIAMLKKKGFKDIKSTKKARTGSKVYKNLGDKAIIAFIVGKDMQHLNIIGSHVDCPRLDIKPNPLYEDSGLAMMQSHYYGGIKKYHWVNLPLSMQGVVFTKSGKKIVITIGEKDSEPKFIIPDLLPHLARDQMDRKASKTISGEELNIIMGNMPINDEKVKEEVKFTVMKKLNDEYGIVEDDFQCAELEFVPSGKPVDLGLDKSMVGAYGQDDRVCAYTSAKAFLEINNPKNTCVCFFADKEEIGSVGNTGAASLMLQNFASDYINLTGIRKSVQYILENAKSVSADVTCGLNPNYKDVNDPSNASHLSCGVSVEKYGGGGGKYSTNDASAEYMQEIRSVLDKGKIPWQTGELGKIDVGGGGTIAMFMSKFGMDCLDVGPCILGMHSTCEVTSKADIYCTYLFYKEFFMSKLQKN